MYDPLFLPTDLSLAILLCHLEAERSFCLQPYFTLSITKKLIYYQVKTIKGKKILKHLKVFKGQSALSKVKTNNRMLGCIQEFLEDKSDSLKHILIGQGVGVRRGFGVRTGEFHLDPSLFAELCPHRV